ncbi:autotransporter outer membrane beta-barrel domain-containing protein [Endozoicomonas arenosclerae]|uniref:autotransporter outer membrane beta-barrel domain-containing protein n=1 Tax=Endozoicomonas arenosclerae TaxID=1633495 RepID=UPI0007844429|nr:autotransporter outer membrane beta-barrel domain-containing protein [Endozoicomonas arenosclerae]
MRQVQVFKKTLLSVAVVAALGGYGGYSQAQFHVDNKDIFLTVDKLDLTEMVKTRDEMDADDPLKAQADMAVKRYEAYKIKYDEKTTNAERMFVNASFWKQLQAEAPQFFLLGVQKEADDEADKQPGSQQTEEKPTEEKPLEKRAKAVLDKVQRNPQLLDAAETKSNFSGEDHGLHKRLVKRTGQDLQKAQEAHLKSLVALEDAKLQDVLLVEKEVMDEATKKTKKVKVAPDAIVLKGMDLSDEGVRKTVLEKLAKVPEVFELKKDDSGKITQLGFKTKVLDLAAVSSGFKEGERVPVVASAASGEGVDKKAHGTVVLSEKSNAVHEGFGTKERGLEAFVAKEGTSVRVAKDGAIRSTIIYLKDVEDVTGVDVEGEAGKTTEAKTFVDLIAVLPEQIEVMEESKNENGEVVKKPVARKTTMVIVDGAKNGTVNIKGQEEVLITGAKLNVRQVGVKEDGVTPASTNVHLTDSDITVDAGSDDVANGGKGVVAGQNVVLTNTRLRIQEENKITLEEATPEESGDDGKAKEKKQPKSITVTEIKAVPVKGLNAKRAMEGSTDGFDKHIVDVEAEDVPDVFEVRKGSVAHVSLTDFEKVLVEDGYLHADVVSTVEQPLASFELKGNATVRSMSKDAQPVFVRKDADVTLSAGQDVAKDIHGFRNFVLDGGTLEGNLKGFAAEKGEGEDPKRFAGSTVTLKAGTLKGGEIGGLIDGEENEHVKEVRVTGQVEVKPGTSDLTALDAEASKKAGKAIYQSTDLKQTRVVAPLVIDSDGSLKIYKTFKESKGEGEKATSTAAPSLVVTNGKTLEKGANLVLAVDLNDSSLASTPYASVEGGLKLKGQNKVKLDLSGMDGKKRFEHARKLYQDAKSGTAVAASIAAVEVDKVEGDFVAPETGTVFLDASQSGFTKSEKAKKSMYSLEVKYDRNPTQKLRSQFGLTENQANMYVATNEAAMSTSNMVSSEAMYNVMTQAEERKEITLFADQQLPDLNNGVGRASVTLQNKVNESIGRRLNSGRTGVNAGDMFESQGFWAEYIFSDGKLDNKDGVKGYEAKVNGVTLGIDSMLNDQMTVGFAFTFGDTKVETNDINRDTTTDTYMGTLYTGWTQDNYFLDAMFSYGKGTNEYKRKVQLQSNTSYKGEADSTIWGARFVAGYNYQMNQWILQPQIAFDYASVDFDDVTEKLTGDLAQKRKMKEFEVMELGAGMKLLGDFEMGRGTLQPEFVLMGYHDFKDDKPETTVTILQGDVTRTFTGSDREQNRFLAGLGVSYKMENNLSLGLHYDHNWMGDYKADSFNATVRYEF